MGGEILPRGRGVDDLGGPGAGRPQQAFFLHALAEDIGRVLEAEHHRIHH